MHIVFIANDGRQFDNQWECENYEEQQKIATYNLKSRFFDENRHLMDITDLARCVEQGWYMEIATMEEAKLIAKYAEENVGIVLFEGPPQVGRFYYSNEDERWMSIEVLYNAYANALSVFE